MINAQRYTTFPMAVVSNHLGGKRLQRRRAFLIAKQENLCHWCHEPMTPPKRPGDGLPKETSATLDYVIPRSAGGTACLANTVAAHDKCNNDRNRDMLREERHGR